LSVFLVPLVRIWMKDELLRAQWWGVPAVIYGSDEAATHIVNALRHEPGLGYYPIGNFRDQGTAGDFVAGLPVLGSLSDTTDRAVVAIVTKIKGSVHKEIRLIEGPLSKYQRVIIIPDLLDAPSLWVTPRDFMGVLGLELTSNLLNPWVRVFKRLSEIVLILLTSLIWLPLMGLLIFLVWAHDRNPPFFHQERTGYKGKEFRTMKFRTMLPNAEEELKRVMEQTPGLVEEWSHNFKLKNDPRITPIGAFLRKTSLDELPQLFNVLKGEMSIVGPRPLPRYHEKELPERVRKLRECVRPGITGLWQVSGRSDVGTAGMERWDTYYVRNWSIWLDIVILVRTVRAVAHGRGAY
jgi:Undecaprenyl-phosphate galactose phosphotransferase WbaP